MSGIDNVKFNAICEHLSNNVDSLRVTLKRFDTSTDSFYRYVSLNSANAEQYAQARSKYVENRLEERDLLNAELLEKLQECDPKIANALQNAYKERIRQIEWDVMKLLPRKYGDKLDVTSNGETVSVAGSLSEARKRAAQATIANDTSADDLI